MPTPPDRAHAPKRHRSQQRDQILAWLRATDSHPTAREIHAGLLPELSGLSLGTVYRNLEVLVAEGTALEVTCAGGVARYDANVLPHHHFHCERCGRIVDVALALPRGLSNRLASSHGLNARRTSISFFGLCPACERKPARRRSAQGAKRKKVSARSVTQGPRSTDEGPERATN